MVSIILIILFYYIELGLNNKPSSSLKLNNKFILCIACPLAPLIKLSITEIKIILFLILSSNILKKQ